MNDGERQDNAGIELEDVFQEFLLLADVPDASTLDMMVAKYPRFASELSDFAVEWATQDLLPGDAGHDEVSGFTAASSTSSAVATAMDRLHVELDQPNGEEPWRRDPFKDRTPAELKHLGDRLGLDKTLVAKLRDRRIEASTVPSFLSEQLASELEVPLNAVIAHLQAPPILSAGASFKATGKPEAVGKEPFAQAVERSQLGADDKKRLLYDDSDIG